MEEKDSRLQKVARRCADPDPKKRYHDLQDLHLALESRSSRQIYLLLILFVMLMIVLAVWVTSTYGVNK